VPLFRTKPTRPRQRIDISALYAAARAAERRQAGPPLDLFAAAGDSYASAAFWSPTVSAGPMTGPVRTAGRVFG
jgi:hypothetical protein